MNPLVSALMPTYNRRAFIPRAMECFLSQDYPNLDLIILDDGTEPIKDLLPADPRIKYFHEQPKKNHGEKMNRCMELMQGEIGIVFDDDDFYPADRITRQIVPFENPTITLTGTSTFYFYEYGVPNPKAWRYTAPKQIGWMMAIAFRKSLWETLKFDPITAGADYNFIKKTPIGARLDLNNPDLIVAAIHPNNTCRKQVGSKDYQLVPWETVQKLWQR